MAVVIYDQSIFICKKNLMYAAVFENKLQWTTASALFLPRRRGLVPKTIWGAALALELGRSVGWQAESLSFPIPPNLLQSGPLNILNNARLESCTLSVCISWWICSQEMGHTKKGRHYGRKHASGRLCVWSLLGHLMISWLVHHPSLKAKNSLSNA